jgi:hypothetical protein
MSLHTTSEGVRWLCNPMPEISKIHRQHHDLSAFGFATANERLKSVKSDLLHAVMDLEIAIGLGQEIYYWDNPIVYDDGNFTKFNGFPCESERPGAFRFRIEMILDRTSVERYVDGGRHFTAEALRPAKNSSGLEIRGALKIHRFDPYELDSIRK